MPNATIANLLLFCRATLSDWLSVRRLAYIVNSLHSVMPLMQRVKAQIMQTQRQRTTPAWINTVRSIMSDAFAPDKWPLQSEDGVAVWSNDTEILRTSMNL